MNTHAQARYAYAYAYAHAHAHTLAITQQIGEQRHRAECSAGLLGAAPALPGRVPPRNGRWVPPPAVSVLRASRGRFSRDH